MLYKVLQTAIPYAQELELGRISLGLPTGSNLGLLISHSLHSNPEGVVPQNEFVQRVRDVTIMDGATTEAELCSERLEEDLVPLVTAHLRMAREIGALSSAFSKTIRGYADNAPTEDATASFRIVNDELGQLFDDSGVQSDLEGARPPTTFVGQGIVAGPRTFEDLIGLLVTGRPDLDQAVQSTVAQYGKEFLENLWLGLFYSGQNYLSPYAPGALPRLPSGERLSVAYLGYLMCQRLYSQVPDDAVGNLSTYQRNIADLRDHLLAVAGVAMRERANQANNKAVVLSYSPSSRTVVVNGPVYREWLQNGGQPEVILGCLLADASSYTAFDLDKKRDVFVNQWNAHAAFHNAEGDVRRVRFLRGMYLAGMTEAMMTIEPFEEKFRKENRGHAEAVLAEVQRTLESTSLCDLEDTDCTALKLVAGIRFAYTPAKLILEHIDQTLKSTPGVDPREAALVAALAYLAKYFAGHITASKF